LNYKVIVKKCTDPAVAYAVATEISNWSGSPVGTIISAISAKDVVVRKEADEQEALSIKERFEKVGALVVLTPLGESAPVAVAPQPVTPASSVATPQQQVAATTATVTPAVEKPAPATNSSLPSGYFDDEDEEEEEGRVLTDAEYAEMLKSRADIFEVETDRKMNIILLTSLNWEN
jgi:hypothetical protein